MYLSLGAIVAGIEGMKVLCAFVERIFLSKGLTIDDVALVNWSILIEFRRGAIYHAGARLASIPSHYCCFFFCSSSSISLSHLK